MTNELSTQSRVTELRPRESATHCGTWVKWAALAWALAIVAFHLGSAALGKPLYRYLHIGEAIGFANGSINLLNPVIIGWNLNNSPTPQDLPLWQAAVAVLFKLFGIHFGLANVVSLVLFFTCLYPLYRLAERFGPPGCGWWAVLLFLAQPIVFLYAGLASSDGFALGLSVWFMFCAMRLIERQNLGWLLLTALAGGLAAVSKVPFFMAAGLACFFMVAAQYRDRLPVWVWLGIAAVLIGLAFMAWEHHANHCYAQAELSYQDLTTSSSSNIDWFFGNMKYRLSPGVWVTGAWRILTTLFGSFALAGLFLLALFRRESSGTARWWLAGAVVTTLIFFHLVFLHHHYYLMFAPGLAILCAEFAAALEQQFNTHESPRQWGLRVAVALALALGTIQGLAGEHVNLFMDDYPRAMAQVIQQHTQPSEKLLMHGGDLTGELLILAHRDGLSVYDLKILDDPATYQRLKSLGYTKVVMVSESPLVAAIKRSTKTHLDLQRVTYQTAETPLVERMPTLLQTEDILIKQLP